MRTALSIAAILLAGAMPAANAADPGETLYNAKCSVCHQAGGIGAPGQFPPLKNRIDKIAGSPEGKHYLADLLLYGMVGKIEAGGAAYIGYMPGFKAVPDADIAAILSFLSAEGDSKPAPAIAAGDIAAARAKPVSSTEVAKERKNLAQLHPLP